MKLPLFCKLCCWFPFFQKWAAEYVTHGLTTGSLSAAERDALSHLGYAVKYSNGEIVELGTLFGFSTRLLATVTSPSVITVDDFRWNPLGLSPQQHRRLTCSFLADLLGSSKVALRCQSSAEFFAQNQKLRPSLVFIDAGHDYESVRADIAGAKSIASKDTIICGHDYCEKWPGVMQAVDEAGGCSSLTETLWVLNK